MQAQPATYYAALEKPLRPRLKIELRGSKGFDGGLETKAAIRGGWPRKNIYLKINADNKLALAA